MLVYQLLFLTIFRMVVVLRGIEFVLLI